MECLDVTKYVIAGFDVVMVIYFAIQLFKEKNETSYIAKSRFILISMFYWILLTIVAVGRPTIFFTWN